MKVKRSASLWKLVIVGQIYCHFLHIAAQYLAHYIVTCPKSKCGSKLSRISFPGRSTATVYLWANVYLGSVLEEPIQHRKKVKKKEKRIWIQKKWQKRQKKDCNCFPSQSSGANVCLQWDPLLREPDTIKKDFKTKWRIANAVQCRSLL